MVLVPQSTKRPPRERNLLPPCLYRFETSGRTNGPAAKCEYGCDFNLLESKSREYLVLLDLILDPKLTPVYPYYDWTIGS